MIAQQTVEQMALYNSSPAKWCFYFIPLLGRRSAIKFPVLANYIILFYFGEIFVTHS